LVWYWLLNLSAWSWKLEPVVLWKFKLPHTTGSKYKPETCTPVFFVVFTKIPSNHYCGFNGHHRSNLLSAFYFSSFARGLLVGCTCCVEKSTTFCSNNCCCSTTLVEDILDRILVLGFHVKGSSKACLQFAYILTLKKEVLMSSFCSFSKASTLKLSLSSSFSKQCCVITQAETSS
jgi:hypothetical protein